MFSFRFWQVVFRGRGFPLVDTFSDVLFVGFSNVTVVKRIQSHVFA